MSRTIELVEVSPRDGLQNEKTILETDDKVELINRAVDAGVKRIEAASFVNPKRVPQMADGEAVLAALPAVDGVTYIGLTLNRRGFDRAQAAGVKEINYALVASDTFSQKNQGTTIEEACDVYEDMAKAAHAEGIRASVTISTAFGCPFQGEVPVERVLGLVERVAQDYTTEIAIADTIGCGVPSQVAEIFGRAREIAPDHKLRAHFHNTRNTGLANAYAAVEAGAHAIDASIGGFGGCPFAPAATGNIPSEDLVFMLERMGVATGVDIDKLIDAADWLAEKLGRGAPAMLGKAGVFPPKDLAA